MGKLQESKKYVAKTLQSRTVSYMFERKGMILVAADDNVNEDELMEAALEAGAEDFITEEDGFEIITALLLALKS